MSARTSVVLKKSNVCELGHGAYGKVCKHRSRTGQQEYAVKTSHRASAQKAMLREKKEHFDLYEAIPPNMKKHFPRPVEVRWKVLGPIDHDAYGMEAVPRAIRLSDVLQTSTPVQRTEYLKQLRKVLVTMWKTGYIHGDIHLNNIVINGKTGDLVVLDFGFLTKVSKKPPASVDGNGTNGIGALNTKWVEWFRGEWERHLNKINMFEGNPNLVAWPRQLTNNTYYFARDHKAIIKGIKAPKAPKATVAQLKLLLMKRGLPTTGTKQTLLNRLKANKPPAAKKAVLNNLKVTTKAKKTVAQLKASLRARALPVTGTKQVLQNRLNARIAANKLIPTPRYAPTPQKSKTPPQKRTVAQLKAELKKRGLPLGGLKKNLQNRLNANNAGGKPAPKKRTVLQLKASLRARALPVTGSKQVLQNRLNARIAANKLIPSYKV